MKRVEKTIASATRKANTRRARVAPLIVPHGGEGAGRDFESAFDVLRRDECAHELWHREPTKKLSGAA
jgi:hypothetical protein